MLSIDQVDNVVEMMNKHFLVFVGQNLGPDYLSIKEKKTLKDAGFDLGRLYKLAKDPVMLSFHLGLISKVIGDRKTVHLSYDDLKSSIVKGTIIPLNKTEKATIDSIKRQYLGDIRSLRGRIFTDFNNVTNDGNRRAQENFLRREIVEGVADRRSRREITRDIMEKTGDWNRDFSKIVEYVAHTALNEGRAAMVERKGIEKVYFQVQDGACKHCIKHYLTSGWGSQPKLFQLEELRANGNNIGKKVINWSATISPMHPYCRCLLTELPPGYVWNQDRGQFTAPDRKLPLLRRPKIKIQVAGKTHYV